LRLRGRARRRARAALGRPGIAAAGLPLLAGAVAAWCCWPRYGPRPPRSPCRWAADLIAYIPTMVHAWRKPHEETWSAYALYAAAAWLALAVADFGVFAAVAYPAYLAVADTAVTASSWPGAALQSPLPAARPWQWRRPARTATGNWAAKIRSTRSARPDRGRKSVPQPHRSADLARPISTPPPPSVT